MEELSWKRKKFCAENCRENDREMSDILCDLIKKCVRNFEKITERKKIICREFCFEMCA